MQDSYLVSALVSTYNSAKFIGPCLDDLLAQTLYKKNLLEIIVIDSGSLENEGALVAEYQKRFQHIRYLRTERETVYGAWNRGIKIAQGTYITNANTDDAHRNDALEILAAALTNYPEADLAYGHCAFTKRPNDIFPSLHAYLDCQFPAFCPALGMFYCLLGPHPLWRKKVFSKIGLFDFSFVGAGDYDFQLRFIQAGLQAVLVPETLSLFYQNPSGLSLSSNRTIVESKEVEVKQRALIPIDRLYSVDLSDTHSIAGAWVAQGNLALTWECAWEKTPAKDYHYAAQCYYKALCVLPDFVPAINNLICCLALQGKWLACEYIHTRYRHVPGVLDYTAGEIGNPIVTVNTAPRISSLIYLNTDIDLIAGQTQPVNPLSLSTQKNDLGQAFECIQQAVSAINSGDKAAALEQLRKGAGYGREDVDTVVAIGILMLGLGDYDTAQELFLAHAPAKDNSNQIELYLAFARAAPQETGPKLLPGEWLDRAFSIFSELELKALRIPINFWPLLMDGIKAEEQENIALALAHYRAALARCEKTSCFFRTLEDKIAVLTPQLGLPHVEVPAPILLRHSLPSSDHSLSRLCRQADYETAAYQKLCFKLAISPHEYCRKYWEYYFVAEGLMREDLLRPGTRGLGFGVGKERLISYFAKHGCIILATDLEPDNATKKAWVDTNQHSDSINDFFMPGICDFKTFERQVQFAYVNMNHIPQELQQEEFDFTWSCCAFEHVGSIEQGKQFILNQMNCLKPGGVALHTTEFNLSSDVLTVDTGPTVIFRKTDIDELANDLRREGHEIVVSYDVGDGELDRYVDIPPYMTTPDKRHLRLLLSKYVTTSIGLFIRKKS